MARKFFYVCAGMLCLSLAFHFGYTTARAQAPANSAVNLAWGGNGFLAVTAAGDIYFSGDYGYNWARHGNIFSGGPVPAQRETWGQVKARYAPSTAAPTAQTNDR